MSNLNLTREQQLQAHHAKAPQELIHAFESMCQRVGSYVDIKGGEVGKMYSSDVFDIVQGIAMESAIAAVESMMGGREEETAYITTESGDMVPTTESELHQHNIKQLLENSAAMYRQAGGSMNPHNLNQLTPFDAFVPQMIIRSYIPMVAKEIIPFETSKKHFIRLKKEKKYVVTKKGEQYLRPDVFRDPAKTQEILDSAKGKRVSDKFYPEVAETEESITYPRFELTDFNILTESGGNPAIGDALDINVHIAAVKMVVDGEEYVIEGLEIYPDPTSVSPQRSISKTIKLPIRDHEGAVTKVVEDSLYGEFNARTSTFNLVSRKGLIVQVQFGGNLSNKNNTEYLSYSSEWETLDRPIPEGYRGNVPITHEDYELYMDTASIDIVANAVQEMTDIFTNAEDTSVFHKFNVDRAKWEGRDAAECPFEHFQGKIVFNTTVDVSVDTSKHLKMFEQIQDVISHKVSRVIADVRNTLKEEPFKMVFFCHPNVASLFVGSNVDWTVTNATTTSEGVKMTYDMGIITVNGDKIKLVSTQKVTEAEGLRFVVLPVNETNFQSWKHFKQSLVFKNDHRISEMSNVPNILGISKFTTESFVPFQGQIKITGYDK